MGLDGSSFEWRGGPCYDAPCDGPGYGHRGGRGYGPRGGGGGYGHCLRVVHGYQHETIFVKALAQASGKSESVIRTDLEKEHVRYVMDKYKVDPAKMDAAMKNQSKIYIQNAVKAGSLTKEQGEYALKELDRCYTARP